jgi:hypothetical protein
MSDLIPPSTTLVPPPGELRHRLAVALRDVNILRRLIRVAEYAAQFGRATESTPTGYRQGVPHV